MQPVVYISIRQRFHLEEEVEEKNQMLQNYSVELEERVRERTVELEKEKIKAEKSEKLKSLFLANMSHEIRTPLNAIIGFTELMDHQTSKEDNRLFLEKIRHSGQLLLIIVNDIQMPVMDGLEAVRIIRNREKEGQNKRLPVVALSAGAFDSDKNEAISAGCDEYLSKPVNLQNLSVTLAKFLNQ